MFPETFRSHPRLSLAFGLALALTLLFAVRLTMGVIYWSAHHEEPIRPWMPVGYVAKSWDLNPRVIDQTAGLPPPEEGHLFTLQEIADKRAVPVSTIIKQVEDAVAKLRANWSGSAFISGLAIISLATSKRHPAWRWSCWAPSPQVPWHWGSVSGWS